MAASVEMVLFESILGKVEKMTNKYAIIENQTVVNIVVADPQYAQEQNWVPLPEGVAIGWTYDGTNATPPKLTISDTEREALDVRKTRNLKLVMSDWTQLPDVPVSVKTAWAAYRQALRDIPAQAGFPREVQWPTQPE